MHNFDHPHTKWKKEDCELLTKLWNEGAEVKFIAQAFGVSKNAVVGIRHRFGLPIRQRPTKGPYYTYAKGAVKR